LQEIRTGRGGFRSIEDKRSDDDVDLFLNDFDFWRATVGVTFRFGGD
jgi:hypothetical protein